MSKIETAVKATGSVRALADAISSAAGRRTSTQSIYAWMSGKRRVPSSLCPAIEKTTSGAIRCEDLRPDVDWAYLRGTAPIPTPQAPTTAQETNHA